MIEDTTHIKILFALFSIIIIVLTPIRYYYLFWGYFFVAIFFLFFLHIPIKLILKKTLTLLPLLFFIALFLPFRGYTPLFSSGRITIFREGVLLLLGILSKSWISLVILTILYYKIPFPRILKGMKKLGIPEIFILLLSFMFRYMELFLKLSKDMEKARELRDFGKGRLRHIKVYANTIGLLFIKAYERGDAIYDAMLLRGFDPKRDD